MRKTLDLIYNGAWNNLELSKSSKKAFITSGLIVAFGVGSFFYILNQKK